MSDTDLKFLFDLDQLQTRTNSKDHGEVMRKALKVLKCILDEDASGNRIQFVEPDGDYEVFDVRFLTRNQL